MTTTACHWVGLALLLSVAFVAEPLEPVAGAQEQRRADQIAQEVIATAGREDVALGPDAKRAVAEVLAAYMPHVFLGMDGGAARLSGIDLAEKFRRGWPEGYVVFDEMALESTLSRVLTDPAARGLVARAAGRYGWQSLMSSQGTADFVYTARVIGGKIRRLGDLHTAGTAQAARERKAIEDTAYAEMRVLSSLLGPDTSGLAGPLPDTDDILRDAQMLRQMDARAGAADLSEENEFREWGITMLRVYQQFVGPDAPAAKWLEARLPDPRGTTEEQWQVLVPALEGGVRPRTPGPRFEGDEQEKWELSELLDLIDTGW